VSGVSLSLLVLAVCVVAALNWKVESIGEPAVNRRKVEARRTTWVVRCRARAVQSRLAAQRTAREGPWRLAAPRMAQAALQYHGRHQRTAREGRGDWRHTHSTGGTMLSTGGAVATGGTTHSTSGTMPSTGVAVTTGGTTHSTVALQQRTAGRRMTSVARRTPLAATTYT